MAQPSKPGAMETDLPDSPETLELTAVYDVAISSLRMGFRLAAALFVIGIAWSAVEREDIATRVTPIEDIPRQLADGAPMAAIVLSFLVLMFTPVVTVLCIGVSFLRLGDRWYGLLSFVVLAILGASMALALIR